MRRWLFYNALAWRDISRLWRATQHQVIIVAGICLPVLLLLGLKRGHVAELRRELVTSPSGRQVVFWSAQQGALLSGDVLQKLKQELPSVVVVVPETQRVVALSPREDRPNDGESVKESIADDSLITLYATDVGDPILDQFRADVLRPGERAVVLNDHLAKELNVRSGDDISLTVFRRRDGVDESHVLPVRVKSLIPSQGGSSRSGYANIELLVLLEQYVRGYAVPELGLPAIRGLTPADEYESYLVFCQKGAQTELTEGDRAFLLDRGIHVDDIEDVEVKGLYGFLDASRLNELKVYRLTQGPADVQPLASLKTSPLFIAENTQAIDDFVLRWNRPTVLPVNGQRVRFVGLSLPTVSQTGGWIQDYLAKPAYGFDFESSLKTPLQVRFVDDGLANDSTFLQVELGPGVKIPLAVSTDLPESKQIGAPKPDILPPTSSPIEIDLEAGNPIREVPISPRPRGDESSEKGDSGGKQPARTSIASEESATVGLQSAGEQRSSAGEEYGRTAVVPANCLAWLRQTANGKLVYDPLANVFTAPPSPVVFDKARVYTATIDDVPAVVAHLSGAGYAVLSESNRIAEIRDQDRSLQTLVVVVGLGVFIFGTITVVGVLVDATERKRGTIGVLRVMGMSRAGIFFVVVARALIVGILSASLSVGIGAGLAWVLASFARTSVSLGSSSTFLASLPPISIVFRTEDYLIVAGGALICSGLGALFPAWRASSIDPFDAIVEGKFH